MAFKGKHLVCCKIEIGGTILEKVKQFNYLGCERERDFDKKMNRFQLICVIIRTYVKKSCIGAEVKGGGGGGGGGENM
jgi:hypothetical protein